MRDPKYRAYCRTQACVVSGAISGEWIATSGWAHFAIIDPAHTERNGKGSKGPDSSCAPLERALHEEYDKDRSAAGRIAFENKYNVNMKAEAAKCYSRYLKESV